MSCSQITKLADADRVFLSEFLNKQQGSPKGSKNKNMAAIEGPPFFCHADTRAALFQRAALTNERPLQLAGNVHHDGLLPTRPRRLFFSFFRLTVVSVIQQDVRRPQVVNRPHRKLLFERWLSVHHQRESFEFQMVIQSSAVSKRFLFCYLPETSVGTKAVFGSRFDDSGEE